MSNNENQAQDESFNGYSMPGQDRIIQSKSDAVQSPSVRSEDRADAPDAYIGGAVNARPGSANPALAETIGAERGEVTTADLLRARESAEETYPRRRGAELYEDQSARGQMNFDESPGNNIDETIYKEHEFGNPTEPSYMDMLVGRMINPPDEENDVR